MFKELLEMMGERKYTPVALSKNDDRLRFLEKKLDDLTAKVKKLNDEHKERINKEVNDVKSEVWREIEQHLEETGALKPDDKRNGKYDLKYDNGVFYKAD